MDSLLSRIKQSSDIKSLRASDLEKLAAELRERIVCTVARTGGHLASNLGVVELTVALHHVFDIPQDKIIWDVGHQTYAHKLLTGRQDEFPTLRQHGGLSGFPKPEESPADPFATGHSSTSISAALGFAEARDLVGGREKVVAVIGDGALTGGMAFEALNHAGHRGTDLIVVLNDNAMSIAKNVGAMASYLSRLRTDPTYRRVKADVEYLLHKIPRIGTRLARTVERLKDSLKYFLVPGMLFEEMGFTYLGPVDGHKLEALIPVLRQAKNTPGPVFVHVVTKKGMGYAPAEKCPDKYHGVSPFNIQTGAGQKISGPPSYTSVFGQTLVRIAEQDERVVAITAAMPDGTGLNAFAEKFPRRFFDVGIAEEHAATFAAGLAAGGRRPVFAVYSTFLQRAYDQVIHDVAMQKWPVVFAVDRAGVVGEDGETHQGVFDLAFLRSIPNLIVAAPKDENELQHLLYTALRQDLPFALRYPRGSGVGIPLDEEYREISVGSWEMLRQGTHGTILAIGACVYPALQAADLLEDQGLSLGVVNARFVKPLDEKLLLSIADRGPVFTVEDHLAAGGFGSAVLEFLSANGINTPVWRLGYPDKFIEHGERSLLLAKYGLDAQGIAKQVSAFLAAAPRPLRCTMG